MLTILAAVVSLGELSGGSDSLTPERALTIAAEVKANLDQHIRAPWYPRSVDRARGGFMQDYSRTWEALRPDTGEKSLVYQSRLTYFAAQVALHDSERAEEFRGYARHGVRFLRDALWDRENGGFYWAVAANGKPETGRGTEKHVYGIAFGIYAVAQAYRATKDADALTLAKDAFLWLERHAHDGKNGGYYEALYREGEPLLQPPAASGQNDPIGTRYGLKSMNSHIHLLEAFTALYHVWPEPQVKTRLDETFRIVRDRVTAEDGYLYLFFQPDWTPVPDHDSFGHDVETAFLLLEAAETLGLKRDVRTEKVARSLVDHAMKYGWDKANGGFFEAGKVNGAPTDTGKVWWTQAEGLNALLLMHTKYAKETPVYGEAFVRQWAFIRDKQTDSANAGWLSRLTAQGAPDPPQQNKSDAWKDPYHQGRAVLHVLEALHRLVGTK